MLADAGFLVLLAVLFAGYVLGMPFILWLKSRATEEEQERLRERATNLERRLAKTEKELEAIRQLTAERTTVEVLTPKPEQPETLPVPEKLTTLLAKTAEPTSSKPSTPLATPPPPPPIPAAAIPTLGGAMSVPPPPSVASPSPVPPPPKPPTTVFTPPQPAFNFEQFLGVKLFAWIGAFVGFLAVAFALKYSFDQGWVSPAVRVAGGLVIGISLLVGALKLNRERYAVTVQSLCGAGVVILYADFFTAHALYKLIESPYATFALMSLVTAVAFFLAVRLNAQAVAILGLLGGFLTPILIRTGHDNPLGLFGYVALLDIGLLAVALRQRWLHLTLLAGIATVLMQVVWAGEYFAVEKINTAMTVFVFFSALFFAFFTVVHRVAEKGAEAVDKWSSAAAVVLPSVGLLFALCVFLKPYRDLCDRPGLMFSFIFLLDLALLGVAWTRDKLRPVQLLGGGASFFLLMVWTGGFLTNDLLNWSLGFTLLFAVLHSVFPVVQQRLQPNLSPVWWMHLFPPVALLLLLVPLMKLDASSFLVWPVVLLVDVLAIGLALFTASLVSVAVVLLLTMFVTACWIMKIPAVLTGWTGMPGMLLVIGGFAVFFFAAAFFALKRILPKLEAAKTDPKNASGLPLSGSVTPELAVQLSSMAAVLPFLLLTMVVLRLPLTNPSPVFGLAVLLIALLLGVVRRFGTDLLAPVALGCTLLLEFVWHTKFLASFFHNHEFPEWPSLAWYVGFSAVFTMFPFVCHRQVGERRLPWATAALALPLHFPLIYGLCKANLPAFDYLGLVPAVCALPAFAGLVWLLKKLPAENEGRNALLALFGGVGLFFITLIFPIQFEKQWLTVAWALEGVALLWLFHRVPHPGLPLVGVALLCVAFARLAFNGAIFSYHPRSDTPLLNWYLYTYGIVTVCLFAGARLLAPPRNVIRDFNVLPLLYSLGTVLAFILVNIEIADYFSEGTRTTFELLGGGLSREKQLGRDMTYSLAWAAFAFVLLVIGFKQRVIAARRAGMALLGVTLVKLFFHDLWRLGGLYRIGALIGLAVVLILVSMFYQKFLATEAERPESTPAGDSETKDKP